MIIDRRVAFAVFALALLPGHAGAHAALTGAAPSADSVAQGAPSVVELTFSEAVEPGSGRITVKGPDGKRVDGNDVHAVGDRQHLAVTLKLLAPGRYTVDWRVTGADTRRSAGRYGFTFTP